VLKLLPLLTEAREEKEGDPSFHVVAPSLPNFGFSEAVTKPGFGLAQYAEVCHKLMGQLGYDRYGELGFPFPIGVSQYLCGGCPPSRRSPPVG